MWADEASPVGPKGLKAAERVTHKEKAQARPWPRSPAGVPARARCVRELPEAWSLSLHTVPSEFWSSVSKGSETEARSEVPWTESGRLDPEPALASGPSGIQTSQNTLGLSGTDSAPPAACSSATHPRPPGFILIHTLS